MADNSVELAAIQAGLTSLAARVGAVAVAEAPKPAPAVDVLFALDFGRTP